MISLVVLVFISPYIIWKGLEHDDTTLAIIGGWALGCGIVGVLHGGFA